MFKKIKELLEAGKISEEVAKALDSEVSTALKERNDENAKLRNEKKELEESYKKQLEEQEATLKEQIEKAKLEGKEEVQRELQGKLEALESEKQEWVSKTKEATKEATINKILADSNVVDADLARLYIKEHLALNEDGNPIIKIGDEVLSVENGAKKLFENKPSLLASHTAQQTQGKQEINFSTIKGKSLDELSLDEKMALAEQM
jgi:hypothetical protein